MIPRPHYTILFAVLSLRCVDESEAERAAKAALERAKPAIEQATPVLEKGGELVAAKTAELFADIPGTGELSQSSRQWLERGAENAGEIESVVTRGSQLAPVALEIARVVDDAVDEDYAIEPICQRLDDDEAKAELDRKLAAMPKTQEIEGVKVGFKQLSEVSSEKKVDESAYLVLWRRDDYLLGFVYRTRREIDIDRLAGQTPRLVGLIDGALAPGGG